jgi:hypothetical protein
MNIIIEILLGVFLFAWLIRGVVNFCLGLLQIGAGLIGVVAVVIWTILVAIVSLPLLFIPSKRRTCGA